MTFIKKDRKDLDFGSLLYKKKKDRREYMLNKLFYQLRHAYGDLICKCYSKYLSLFKDKVIKIKNNTRSLTFCYNDSVKLKYLYINIVIDTDINIDIDIDVPPFGRRRE
jgi:protoporphyrinogen oxidase